MAQQIPNGNPFQESPEDLPEKPNFTPCQNLSSIVNDPKAPADRYVKPAVPSSPHLAPVHLSQFSGYLARVEKPLEWFQQEQVTAVEPLEQATDELAGVPREFLAAEFDLRDSATFRAQVADVNVVLQQERVSHWLDLCEGAFVRALERRRPAFFATLAHFRTLHECVRDATASAAGARAALALAQRSQLAALLAVLQQQQRARHARALVGLLQQMARVRDAPPLVRELLAQSDFPAAADALAQARALLDGPLLGCAMLKQLRTAIRDLGPELERACQAAFLAAAAGEKQKGRDGPSLPVQLAGCGSVLLRLARLQVALQAHRERMAKLLRVLLEHHLQKHLAKSTAPTTPGQHAQALEAGVKDLSAEQFLALVRGLYRKLLKRLLHSRHIHSLLVALVYIAQPTIRPRPAPAPAPAPAAADTDAVARTGSSSSVASAESSSPSLSPVVSVAATNASTPSSSNHTAVPAIMSNAGEGLSELTAAVHEQVLQGLRGRVPEHYAAQMLNDLGYTLKAVSDLAHAQCAQLFAYRADAHKRLVLPDFVELYNATARFLTQADAAAGSASHAFRGTLTSQAKLFLDEFHVRRINSLTLILENETWTAAEVAAEFQAIVDRLEGRPVRDLAAAQTNQKQISAGGQPHTVVNSALLLLKLVLEYLQVLDALPALGADVVQKLVELLQLFHLKTHRLVLGAAALQTANLKSITARHLALASQSLDLLAAVLPSLRRQLERHFPANKQALLADLERVRSEYREHRAECGRKIVAILRDRVETCCRTLKAERDWVQEGPPKPLAALLSDLSTLHRVISSLLPADQVRAILADIIKLLNKQFLELFTTYELPTPAGRKKAFKDMQFLAESIRAIDPDLDPGDVLLAFLRNKYQLS